jgi:ureidoacrylate peracid hydrolase
LVVHVRYVLVSDASNAGIMGETVPWIRDGMCSPDADAVAWHKDLVLDDRDLRLEKPRFGAFFATNLEHVLRSRGVDTVIITGIETNICCDTTAREAMQREFRVLFVSDATATSDGTDVTAAEKQRVTLDSMQLFGQVLTTDELIAKIKRAASAA